MIPTGDARQNQESWCATLTGQAIGHYLILEKLGEGGMGVVYKARDIRLDRLVAIKVLPADRIGDEERRARFIREARSASALNHPNIITVYDVNVDGNDLYIAMEFVDGKALNQSIPASGMRLKTVLDAAIQITDALAKAHAVALVHRDLKPGNIMLNTEGRVKLLDFGLAKFMEPAGQESATRTVASLTHEGSIVGTAAYMSPEQAEGKPVDSRSDIFSFGAVLYEMLTGRRAFRGNSAISTLAAVLEKDPEPLAGPIPRDLERIVSRCLRKEPARRFQHAGDIRMALEDVVADAETAGASGTLPAVAAKLTRFRWSYLAIAAAVVLAWGAGEWMHSPEPVFADLKLARLTGDPGLTTKAAISPDGTLIAYASDRAGNGDLDIWVQHRGGGEPIRITHGAADEFDPSFSSDGAEIVYASADGIYLVPALGGEPHRLLKAIAERPRLSPDGKRVVFQNRVFVRTFSRVALSDVGTGELHPLPPDLPGARYPIWSPDGRYLLIETMDYFHPETGVALWRTISADTLKSTVLGPSPGVPAQWLPGDRILYTTFSDRLYNVGGVNNLGIVAISPARAKFTGAPRLLTNGVANIDGGSVAADGTLAVSVNSYVSNLWNLPLDANTGQVKGPAELLTQEVAITAYPSISADGTKLAYSSDRDGGSKVWLMDLSSHRRGRLTTLAENEVRPVLSRDGTKVGYLGGKVREMRTMVADVTSVDQPGPPQEVCDPRCLVAWDWWPDNRGMLVTIGGEKDAMNIIASVSAGSSPAVFTHSTVSLFQAHPSPDGQWLCILGGGIAKIARLQDGKMPDAGQWRETGIAGDLFRWSPDGNSLYFVSYRDSFRCIWGRRLNPATKQPVGDSFPVYHSHAAHLSMTGLRDSGAVGLAVARDRAVFAQAERSGNIWIGKLNLQ